MTRFFIRYHRWLIILLTLGVVAASFYFEYVDGLNPCPLCLMQRVCAIGILMTAMLGIFFESRACLLRFFLFFQAGLAALGVFFSGRQVWLQWLPPEQSTVCMPGFKMIVHYLPWKEVVRTLFLGAGDCAEVSWHWFGLTMPAWAFLYFFGIFICTGWYLYFQENV